MAKALLPAGADPCVVNRYNMSPKMVAQREGHADVVALLEVRGKGQED
jgi:ankyrin repeat protein